MMQWWMIDPLTLTQLFFTGTYYNYDILLMISILITVVIFTIGREHLIFNCKKRYRNIKYYYYY